MKKILQYCFFVGILFLGFTQDIGAYSNFSANADLIRVAPYGIDAISGSGNWNAIFNGFREFLSFGQRHKIRQNGIISQVKIYTANATNLTGFYIKIWRKNGATYDLIGTSNDLSGDLLTDTIIPFPNNLYPICHRKFWSLV